MKKCPHCHEDTFGAFELFTLDYFHSNECENCGNLVRNDGLRQLLVVPAILATLSFIFVVLSIVPEALEPLAWIMIILMFLPIILLAKPVKAEQADATLSPFTPNLRNDKVIMVSGWNEDELCKILDSFIAEADSGPPPGIEMHKQYENYFRLTFPEDIHPSLFASLVNYLMYPIELSTADHSLAVVGKTTLDTSFPGIPETLNGQKAVLYVPENDREYDVVYMQTESGINLANSFGEGSWRRIDEARMPIEVKRLSLSGK